MRRCIWMLIYGIGLYLFWGIVLLFSPEAMGITVMGIFQQNNVSHYVVSMLFLGAGLLTFISLFLKNTLATVLLCFPQQFLLMINAASCLLCIFAGKYADGVVRPVSFILADQFPFVFAGVIHSVVLIDMAINNYLDV